eukprot:505964-Prorocentrum_lima.AAC.1
MSSLFPPPFPLIPAPPPPFSPLLIHPLLAPQERIEKVEGCKKNHKEVADAFAADGCKHVTATAEP